MALTKARLVNVSADPKALLGADPRLRPALGVKWIASLRRLGAVLKAGSSGITSGFCGAPPSDPTPPVARITTIDPGMPAGGGTGPSCATIIVSLACTTRIGSVLALG